MRVRRRTIQRETTDLLSRLGIGSPPVLVERVARALGLEIRNVNESNATMSGFLLREGTTAVIGVNQNHHPNRRRFTIAHEIGHWILHPSEHLYVDQHYRNERSSEGTDVKEKEANLFAAELLMPEEFIRADMNSIGPLDLESDDEIQRLARKYQVSRGAMNNRLNYLDYLEM